MDGESGGAGIPEGPQEPCSSPSPACLGPCRASLAPTCPRRWEGGADGGQGRGHTGAGAPGSGTSPHQEGLRLQVVTSAGHVCVGGDLDTRMHVGLFL